MISGSINVKTLKEEKIKIIHEKLAQIKVPQGIYLPTDP